jgi:CHAT domain-containing protein/Tfp pilus assembly protein PilF
MKLAFFFLLTLFTFPLLAQKITSQEFEHLDSIANVYMEAGQYAEGMAFAKNTSLRIKQELGQSDTMYTRAIEREGIFHFYMGQFNLAQPLFEKAVTNRENSLGKDHPSVAAALSNLSLIYNYQGVPRKAIPLSIRAVAIDKAVYGEDSENYSYSINNLGVLYFSTEKYKKAADCFLTSLKIDKKLLGEEHPDYLSALHNMAVVYNLLGDYTKSNSFFEKALHLRRKVLGDGHPNTLLSLTALGELQTRIGHYELALKYQIEAVNVTLQVLGDQHPHHANALNVLAVTYMNINNFEAAEKYTQKAMAIYEKKAITEHTKYQLLLNNLAVIYMRTYRYRDARLLIDQILATTKKTKGELSSNYIDALGSLSNSYASNKQYEKALAISFQRLDLQEQLFGKKHYTLYDFYLPIAVQYSNLKQYDQSIVYYEKTLQTIPPTFKKNNPKIIFTLQALAFVHEKKGAIKKAKKLYLKALKLSKEVAINNQRSTTSSCLRDLARFYLSTQPSYALSFITNAIQNNLQVNIDSVQLYSNLIELCTAENFWNPENALLDLNMLAQIQIELYHQNNAIAYLNQAHQTLKALTTLSTKIQRNLTNTEDQLASIQYANKAALGGLQINFKRYKKTQDKQYIAEAFLFAEHNKSILLYSILSSQKALTFGNIPDSLIIEEKSISKRLSELNLKLIEYHEEGQTEKIASTKKELLSCSIRQQAFRQHLAKQYPAYNQLKYANQKTTLKQIQNNLPDSQTALLEYFIKDSSTYLIVITKDNSEIFRIDTTTQIKALVQDFRKSLSDYQLITQQIKKATVLYTSSAHKLYQILIAPAQKELQNISRLFIIPDGLLSHIPFEALLTENPTQIKTTDYRNLPYLIQNYTIGYAYSATLLFQQDLHNNTITQNNRQIIGFAAAYPPLDSTRMAHRSSTHQLQRSGLQALSAVEEEVQTIQSIFDKGAFFYGLDANEANFKKLAGDYAVVHLAMHGLLNKNQPLLSSLAFTEDFDSIENNFLAAQEISQLNLKSDLVVLSACETGFGKFEEGEGVLSLARSFMYAGVPSLVVSLWQVNDVSTAFIMKAFYQKLADGLPKDEALRAAKLTYIESSSGNLTAHPAFWSPFIQLGDSKPITINQPHYWRWILGIGSLVLLVGGFVWFRKRNTEQVSL